MPTPPRPVARAIFHRDDTVTYYSVFSGQWCYRVPIREIPQSHIDTLKPDAKARIMKKRDETS